MHIVAVGESEVGFNAPLRWLVKLASFVYIIMDSPDFWAENQTGNLPGGLPEELMDFRQVRHYSPFAMTASLIRRRRVREI